MKTSFHYLIIIIIVCLISGCSETKESNESDLYGGGDPRNIDELKNNDRYNIVNVSGTESDRYRILTSYNIDKLIDEINNYTKTDGGWKLRGDLVYGVSGYSQVIEKREKIFVSYQADDLLKLIQQTPGNYWGGGIENKTGHNLNYYLEKTDEQEILIFHNSKTGKYEATVNF